jgi:hypothetical protein
MYDKLAVKRLTPRLEWLMCEMLVTKRLTPRLERLTCETLDVLTVDVSHFGVSRCVRLHNWPQSTASYSSFSSTLHKALSVFKYHKRSLLINIELIFTIILRILI